MTNDQKKKLAFELSDKFLAEIKAAFRDDDRDEGMVVMIMAARFICQQQADPHEFLAWLNEEALRIIERAAKRQGLVQ